MDQQTQILCVDDEENVLKSLKRLFLDDPYEILTATSGDAGLKILRDEPQVKIVVSDYRMPGMNGVDFLREVCCHWPDTVRMVLSGYADSGAIVSSINEGKIYKFIPKPWNDVEFKSEISNAAAWHDLVAQNKHLAEDLKKKNEDLLTLNEILKERITDKIGFLERENSELRRASSLLAGLCVGVLSLDKDGWISYYNEKSDHLFGWLHKDMIFGKRGELFSGELNAFIDRVIERGDLTETLRFNGRMVSVRGAVGLLPGESGITLILCETPGGEERKPS